MFHDSLTVISGLRADAAAGRTASSARNPLCRFSANAIPLCAYHISTGSCPAHAGISFPFREVESIVAHTKLTWADALADVGCYGFLEPVASQALDVALELCPGARSLLGNGACEDLRDICQARLGIIYERPLIKLAIGRLGFADKLSIDAGGEAGADAMRHIAEAVRDEVAADAGASLCDCLPQAAGYGRAVADNFSKAMAELLGRLLIRRDDVSRNLLGGRPITRVTGISASGADPHRHGRMVMRIETDAGEYYYKPHDCGLDTLYLELVDTWFSDCVRAARLVPGDGYAFVERLVPEELSSEEELRSYWRNLGCLTALFHGLGSRDMTQDNIMCCGVRPAVLDLETLITGEMRFDRPSPADEAGGADLAETVACASVLPQRIGGTLVSPLVADNGSGTCLPRLDGEPRTVEGFERGFSEGFEEGYRRLMRHRGEVLDALGRHADATCRQILLNTWAYVRTRALLFSPEAMSDTARRDEVLTGINAAYDAFSRELRQAVFDTDASALLEGDIPYYCSCASSRTLCAGDGQIMGAFLERSALEVASIRLRRLSEEDLRFELGLIRARLESAVVSGGRL